MTFTLAQQEAVIHKDGPAMILAGPGSGKTSVIVERTHYLIHHYGISPIHILVVTFTKAAAEQMKQRFLKRLQSTRTEVRFGTFHSVFYEILKSAYHINASNIAGEDAKYRLLREAVRPFDLDTDDEAELLADIAKEISLVKNEQIPLEHFYATSVSEEQFRGIFQRYEQLMEQERLLDYDDLMIVTLRLFKERPDILNGWRNRYQYIAVDEFQDINRLQYEIIRLLASPNNNLFVVGDDDQSIYRFRGAKPEIMLHFPKDYPSAKKVFLDKNFRCPGNVIRFSEKVIANNTMRFAKNIHAVKEDGDVIERALFLNQTQESLGIIKKVQEYLKQGYRYEDIAVLYRNNLDAGILSGKLMEYNLPFTMRDVMPNLFEHWISKQILAYLRVAKGSRSRADLLLIMNRPKRYISRDALTSREISLEELRTYYEDKSWMLDRIDQLECDLKRIAQMEPYTAVHYVRHAVGYEEYLKEYADYRHMKAEDLYEVADRLAQSAKEYRTQEEWFAYIREYTEMLQKKKNEKKKDLHALTLTTFHGAKGLEFPIVFLIDVNDGVVPYKKALLQSDVEEERRMFYVGITRASEHLHIYSIKEKYGKDMKPSPFMKPFSDL